MDKIAILIPCLDEEASIGKVVKDFKTILPDAVIYVYDNNSSDHTVENAKAAGAIVRQEEKRGKGNVVRRMFREVEAFCYILVDGDDTYDASDSPFMAAKILEEGYDMVIGDRLGSYFTENKRRFHNIGNKFVNKVINFLFDADITDAMSGYRALSRTLVKTFPVLSEGFSLEVEMTAHAADKRLDICCMKIGYKDRMEGSFSKLHTYQDGVRVFRMIFRLFYLYRPMALFGTISIILALAAIIFFIPVWLEYVHTGLVLKFPTLICCGFAFIASLQSLFAGLILQNRVQKDKQEFELRLIKEWENIR